jgi:hypothetical protein
MRRAHAPACAPSIFKDFEKNDDEFYQKVMTRGHVIDFWELCSARQLAPR